MNVVSYSEARDNLAEVLDRVSTHGPVKIRRPDDREYVILASGANASPAEIDGVDTDFTAEEIVRLVRHRLFGWG